MVHKSVRLCTFFGRLTLICSLQNERNVLENSNRQSCFIAHGKWNERRHAFAQHPMVALRSWQ